MEEESQGSGGYACAFGEGGQQRFSFVNVLEAPVPSLLRGFSAPVNLKYPYTDAELTHLLMHDSDAFNRWEAGQRLAVNLLLQAVAAQAAGRSPEFPDTFAAAISRVLADGARDPAFTTEALALPSESYIAEQLDVVDPDSIHAVRVALRRHLAGDLKGEVAGRLPGLCRAWPLQPDANPAGQRALRNMCLGYLMELDDPVVRALCLKQFDTADNMTDAMAALSCLANTDCPERVTALEAFYARWKDEPLVLDKWLAVQATSRLPGTLAEVKRLTTHPAFDWKILIRCTR